MSGEPPGEPAGLSPEHLAAIYRHARAEFPNECCGYVLGAGDSAELVVCENWQDRYHAVDPETFPRSSANAYMFGAKDTRRLADSLDSERPATIVYHSHPRVGAYFSEEDARAAKSAGWPVDYLVVDCQDEHVRGALLFRYDAKRDEYLEVARFAGAAV
jgi:proteasome lid subunit RPN8/RPN11